MDYGNGQGYEAYAQVPPRYRTSAENVNMVYLPNKVTQTISTMVTISAVIWLLIAIYQILVGLIFAIFGVGLVTLLCGAWNIYACVSNFKHAKWVKNCNSIAQGQAIVDSYESSLGKIIIFLITNLTIGGGIGVIGSIYDLILRAYVLKHREELGA